MVLQCSIGESVHVRARLLSGAQDHERREGINGWTWRVRRVNPDPFDSRW